MTKMLQSSFLSLYNNFLIQATYFTVKLHVNTLTITLAMSCTFLSACIEGDKEVTKTLILSEQNDLNLLNRKPESSLNGKKFIHVKTDQV